PDLMMVQGEPKYYQDRPDHERQDTIENPSVVVEVLSKSTRQYDQSDKFDAYRTLDSLREYILIDQYSFWVKQFTKNSQGQWLLTEFIGEDAVLKLQTIDFELAFTDLYKRVKFES
ncbi:MAG: Uma2 family endonuclease, partial [Moorea sp. SIO3C2]|nr:Uma2 family endonuclease [Moorena sp. SIO3C2]